MINDWMQVALGATILIFPCVLAVWGTSCLQGFPMVLL